MNTVTLHNYEAFLLDYSEGNLAENDIAQLKAFALAHPELQIDLEENVFPSLLKETVQSDFKSSLKKTDSDLMNETLLNYLEGNLNPEQKLAFERELIGNKYLAKELELYKKTVLYADAEQILDTKSSLIKAEEDVLLDDRFIAYFEKILSDQERKAFEKELKTNESFQKEWQLVSKTALVADASIVYPNKEALKKQNRILFLFNYRVITSVAAAILLLIGFIVVYNSVQSPAPVKTTLAQGIAKEVKPNITDQKDSIKPGIQNQRFSSTDKAFTKRSKTSKLKNTADREIDQVNTTEKEIFEPQLVKENNAKLVSPADSATKTQNVLLVNKTKEYNIDSSMAIQNYIPLLEEAEDEDPVHIKNSKKKGIWERAVQLARQAHKLGIKSIDGEEDSENNYRLSFNSLSVGKK